MLKETVWLAAARPLSTAFSAACRVAVDTAARQRAATDLGIVRIIHDLKNYGTREPWLAPGDGTVGRVMWTISSSSRNVQRTLVPGLMDVTRSLQRNHAAETE